MEGAARTLLSVRDPELYPPYRYAMRLWQEPQRGRGRGSPASETIKPKVIQRHCSLRSLELTRSRASRCGPGPPTAARGPRNPAEGPLLAAARRLLALRTRGHQLKVPRHTEPNQGIIPNTISRALADPSLVRWDLLRDLESRVRRAQGGRSHSGACQASKGGVIGLRLSGRGRMAKMHVGDV